MTVLEAIEQRDADRSGLYVGLSLTLGVINAAVGIGALAESDLDHLGAGMLATGAVQLGTGALQLTLDDHLDREAWGYRGAEASYAALGLSLMGQGFAEKTEGAVWVGAGLTLLAMGGAAAQHLFESPDVLDAARRYRHAPHDERAALVDDLLERRRRARNGVLSTLGVTMVAAAVLFGYGATQMDAEAGALAMGALAVPIGLGGLLATIATALDFPRDELDRYRDGEEPERPLWLQEEEPRVEVDWTIADEWNEEEE